jgi:hypothetical protein
MPRENKVTESRIWVSFMPEICYLLSLREFQFDMNWHLTEYACEMTKQAKGTSIYVSKPYDKLQLIWL